MINPIRSWKSLIGLFLGFPPELFEFLKFGDGNSNNSGGNSGNGGPASLEQDLIESLAPRQFTAEFTLRHGFPNKPTGKSF